MPEQPIDAGTVLSSAPIFRRVFSRALTALVVSGAVRSHLGGIETEAKNRKSTCKRKCTCLPTPPPEVAPTCYEYCFPEFPLCYERTEGPPLCANGAFTDGSVPCATDQDCLGNPSKPYCLVSETSRDSGNTSRFTTCEPYADGCCISAGIFP